MITIIIFEKTYDYCYLFISIAIIGYIAGIWIIIFLHILNPGIVHPKLTLIGATLGAKAPTWALPHSWATRAQPTVSRLT